MLYKELLQIISNIPFYEDVVLKDKMNLQDELKAKKIFQSLPIIDRGIMQKDLSSFLIRSFSRTKISEILSDKLETTNDYQIFINGKEYWIEYTSGTTGMPLTIIKSVNERICLGINLWKMRCSFSKVTPNEMFCFIHHGNDSYPFPFDFIENYEVRKRKELRYLQAKSYKWWHIFPAQLEVYSKYAKFFDNSQGKLEVIEYNGASVLECDKKRYETLFNCKLANNYGCREVWNIAYSCSNNKLHVNEDNIILELVDEDGEIINESGIVGEIVVTSRNLSTMPFIRYKIGDYGYYEEGMCKCMSRSRVICLDNKRRIIAGTNICGTELFRTVIMELDRYEGINKFEAINIFQKNYEEFIVNIKQCKENKIILQNKFTQIANDRIGTKCRFFFEYNDNKVYKSLFSTKMM